VRGNPPPRRQAGQGTTGGIDLGFEVCGTLSDGAHHGGGLNGQDAYTGRILPAGDEVRRLTPVECERLQGFPDDYTRIPWKKKPADECPDGGRYKALGNSMAVNCMRWIGRRIELVEAS
jgi:DNA (cytosine-5)-methyltransferase 1